MRILAILLALVSVASAQTVGDPYTRGTTIYVSPLGNDAHVGSSASPVRTISNAIWRATSGDTVFVRPGTYAENDLAKDGITLSGDMGADIVYVQTTTNDAGYGIIDDRGKGAVRMKFNWPGKILFYPVTNYAAFYEPGSGGLVYNPNTLGAFVITNSATDVRGRIGSIYMSDWSGAEKIMIYQKSGYVDLEIGEMVDPFSGQAIQIAEGEYAQPRTVGWYWELGNGRIDCKRMVATSYSLYWNEPANNTATNDFYYSGDYLEGHIYGLGNTDNYRLWVRVFEINVGNSLGTGSAIAPYGGGKFYFEAQKINAPLGKAFETAENPPASNSVSWIRAMKISARDSFATVPCGTVHMNADHFENLGSIGNNGLTSSGGGRIHPKHVVSGLTNIAASATSRVVVFPIPMPGTNYTVNLSHNFNPVATHYISSQNRSNFTITYSTGVTTGGNIYWTASQNTQ